MARQTRASVLGLVGTASVTAVVAGLAWACGPSGYGVPESPAPPPSSTAAPPTPLPSTGPSAAAPSAPASGPAVSAPESGSGTASGGGSGATNRSQPQRTPTQGGSGGGGFTTAPSPAGQADINARVQGRTAGVSRESGRPVFASSTAPSPARAAKRGKGKAREAAAKSNAPAVTERSATADLWTGVSSGTNPSLASAAAIDGGGGGLGGGAVAALAVFGLGLVGISGAVLATAARRRRAAVGAAKRQ